MKKINVIAWFITMMMTLVVSQMWAADWGSENVKMQVGETKTLYLPTSVTSKTLKSVAFYSASHNYVEVVSYTNYSVKVKALKATTTPVIVRCDYYYYINYGGYMYQNSGAYDFNITVEGETTVKPTNISIPSTSSVMVGSSFYFVPTVTPAKATYTLTWQSSDNTIASVNQSGMLTGISVGTATITVTTDNGKSATCKVTVLPRSVSNVSINTTLSLEVGETYTLTPAVTPSDAETSFFWSSDNTDVATVSQSGVVTAMGAGTANITVSTANGKSATCKVTVSPKSVTDVSINTTLSLEVSETHTLTPTVTPSDAETSFSWSSDNTSVATVSQSGVVTAMGAGTANITVTTANGKSATCKVTVSPKPVTDVSINTTLSLEVGETHTLTPAVTPSDAETSFTWSSDNTNVATVSQSGLVTARSAGTANITVTTANGKSATCKVIVNAKQEKEYEISYFIFDDGGKVIWNDNELTEYGSFMVKESSDVTLTIIPDAGYKIDWLWVDYEDMDDKVIDNKLTLYDVRRNIYIVVSFEKDCNSDTSAIKTPIINQGTRTIIYDLSGRRVDADKAKGGIFIVNGKKVFIK